MIIADTASSPMSPPTIVPNGAFMVASEVLEEVGPARLVVLEERLTIFEVVVVEEPGADNCLTMTESFCLQRASKTGAYIICRAGLTNVVDAT